MPMPNDCCHYLPFRSSNFNLLNVRKGVGRGPLHTSEEQRRLAPDRQHLGPLAALNSDRASIFIPTEGTPGNQQRSLDATLQLKGEQISWRVGEGHR
jgi:hypothetical protein